MKVSVFTLKGVMYEADAAFVNVMTRSGEITILPGHQPIVTELAPNAAVTVADVTDTRKQFTTRGGFLHVNAAGAVTLMMNQ